MPMVTPCQPGDTRCQVDVLGTQLEEVIESLLSAEPALSGVEWVPAATSYAACLRPAVAGLRRGILDYETTDR